MIVDGRQIADSIYKKLSERISGCDLTPRFTVFTCDPNFETQKYLNIKTEKAKMVGIDIRIIELENDSTTEEFISHIEAHTEKTDGIIVQLPIPKHIDKNRVLESILPSKDVDSLNPATKEFLSPVVGALKEILDTYEVDPENMSVVVIGNGKLVGNPAARWFEGVGAQVTQVTKATFNTSSDVKSADIIVSGAGESNLLTPNHVKDGVIILDAGTSEDAGELRGDADPGCAEKSLLFTPVPGGIGPITIAVLLQNVVDAALRN